MAEPFARERDEPPQPAIAAYLRATETVRDEVDVTLRIAEGALPAALRGVMYRNGPGKMEVYGTKYDHPFDGDGMVTRFEFADGEVRYKNRFVRTREYVAEERAGRMLYRSFGTNLPGGLRRNLFRLRFKNAANTSVVLHGGRLLALWEGGLPHLLDPVTLETRGTYDYGGRLQNRTSRLGRFLAPHLPFSAHPKRDEETGELVNFGTLAGKSNQLVSYRVARDGVMAAPSFTPLRRLSFVHDFVLTPHYGVYFLPAVSFRVAATLLGVSSPAASLGVSGASHGTILLVPRDGRPAIEVPSDDGFVFHFANGYEDEQGRVVLDGMRMDTLPAASVFKDFFAGRAVDLPTTHPTRFVVDPQKRTVSKTRLSETFADLPTIDPRFSGRPYRHFWAIAGRRGTPDPLFHHVLHFDHLGPETLRDFGEDLPGEPLFVPAPGATEAEGWVLTLVYRAREHRTDLFVLAPGSLETLCRVELPHHVPPGFHGTWSPAAAS